ncbi:MAG: HD domain-containing phosphohydrolase [Desulfovibrionaceae bacterium]
MSNQERKWVPAAFFPVSPLILVPEAMGNFSVYLRQDNDFVLYAKGGEKFTEAQRHKLFESGVSEVYVQTTDKPGFDDYVERNLGGILMDESLPLKERSRLFYETSNSVVREAFSERLPPRLAEDQFERLSNVVKQSMRFLKDARALRAIGPFISHDYRTYTHSLQVFVYAMSMLAAVGVPEDELYEYGLGAMLHDIGKTRVPRSILNKRGALTPQERRVVMTHSVQGVALCANLGISQRTFNCILFHHERMDGKGYPSGIGGEDLHISVRAISLADAYDALTSNRPYAPAMRPYDALNLMRHEMQGAFDMDLFKLFIEILSGAALA